MNMKKSLAGVMAGAMAVSAMATVVSADQDAISLTYDLKTYVNDNNKTKAKVTVVANYEGSLVSTDSVKNGYIVFGVDNGYITGGDTAEYNGKTYEIGRKIYNKNGAEIGDATVSKMKEFEFTARPYKDVVNDVEEKYQTFKATGDASNVDGAYYDKDLAEGVVEYAMGIAFDDNTIGKFDLRKYDMNALGYSTEDSAAAIGYKGRSNGFSAGTYGVRDAVAKMTYEVPNTVKLNKANGWGWGYWSVSEAEINGVSEEYYKTSLYGDVTMSAEVFAGGFFKSDKTKKGMKTYNNYAYVWDNGNTIGFNVPTALVSDPTTVSVGAFTAGGAEEAVWPFKTTLKPGLTTDAIKTGYVAATNNNENDVVAALKSRKAGGNYYTKPVAVLKDAIANHDNVVFTFTSYNGYVGTAKSHLVNQWVNMDQGYTYQTSDHDWYNPNFGQHLYTNLDNAYSLFDSNEYDQYGSYSSAWGINLFTGAVVVNSGLTMQLSDTDTFNWGSNTLSFDWFDITDEGKITDAKTFLTSMLLYTPVDWYWDTLTVVVSDDEDEAIDAGEGLDGEGDTIDDEEPADEEIVEEPEVEETEAPAETEAAPVETAPSPATGNAPVALAVIPVALAAAAVVAKKRG